MTNGESDLSNFSMLDLFGMEVETQAAILNENLLALENQQQPDKELEALMRGAHSIKGAARIVQINAAVNIAHVMEDCFVAAQEGAIALENHHIDRLLEGVDLLQRISQVKEENLEEWLSQHHSEIERMESAIQAIAAESRGKTPPETPSPPEDRQPASPAPTATVEDSPAEESPPPGAIAPQAPVSPAKPPIPVQQTPPEAPQSGDRVVRLSAENLNRLMGLAGESLIEANWLEPFADSLLKLKSHQLELSKTLQKLQNSMEDIPQHKITRDYLDRALTIEADCQELLSARINELELFSRRFANLSDRLYREVIDSHMRPFTEGVQGFPRMMRDLGKQLNKQVRLEIIGKSTPVDRDILEKLEAPLTHILRNAIAHGIEPPEERVAKGKPTEGKVRVEAAHRGGMLSILVCDDGRGIELDTLRQTAIAKGLVAPDMANQLSETELMEFLFLPRFSTLDEVTEISGRGFGLDIAKSMVQEVGGFLRAHSDPGKGMTFHLQLPLTLSVIRTLLVEIAEEPYAFPLTRIDRILRVSRSDIFVAENRHYFTLSDRNIGLVAAHQVLDLPESDSESDTLSVLILSDRFTQYGLIVDRFLGERDLVVRPLDPRLGKVRDISAAALMEDGSPVLIVDVEDLVQSIDRLLTNGGLSYTRAKKHPHKAPPRKRILVVDDSITVREMERKLLENNGYDVQVAVNGMDAWNAARTTPYDLIISDVDMPRMNGIELVNQIKTHPKLKSIPVIIVSYKDREEDRIQGLEAGANYYLTKSSFHDDTFLKAVLDTIGKAHPG